MGMLFNTVDTLRILQVVNQAFSRQGLNRLRKDNSYPWATAFGQLPNPNGFGGSAGTYNTVATALGIDLDGGQGLSSKRWHKFLNLLDAQAQQGSLVSTIIGQAIGNAINTKTYAQVEFFAVPSSTNAGPVLTATVYDFTDKNGEITSVITITTSTLDQLASGSLAIQEFDGDDEDDRPDRRE